MQKEGRREKILKYIFFILVGSIPLISVALFCYRDGMTINDVYIPLGGWSDEITYYKQVEGILSHGLPRGYFGYNQTKANFGTLGVWGIFPLIPYIIWGFFFGWNYLSPVYANIFLCTLAILYVCILLRPNNKCMGMLSVFWIVNPFLNRYIVSGVVEAYVILQLLIVTASGIYLLSDSFRKKQEGRFTHVKDSGMLMLCTAIIFIMSLARPYYAVLYLIPLWKALKDKRKVWIISLPMLAIGNIILFFLNNYFFCSIYFNNVLSFEEIKSGGVTSFISKIFEAMIEIARLIWYAVRYKGIGVGWYYLLLAMELLTMIIVCTWRIYHKKRIPCMFLITLIGNLLILISIIELYDLGVGGRHILSLIIANAVILMMETHFSVVLLLILMCVASVFQLGDADRPPYQNTEYVAYMEQLEMEFAKVVDISDQISYDNVVAMPTADTSASNPEERLSCYYGVMFAMPAGVGISLDFENYYNEPENIRAGYILVHPKGRIRTILDTCGMHCIYENEELALYSR